MFQTALDQKEGVDRNKKQSWPRKSKRQPLWPADFLFRVNKVYDNRLFRGFLFDWILIWYRKLL